MPRDFNVSIILYSGSLSLESGWAQFPSDKKAATKKKVLYTFDVPMAVIWFEILVFAFVYKILRFTFMSNTELFEKQTLIVHFDDVV